MPIETIRCPEGVLSYHADSDSWSLAASRGAQAVRISPSRAMSILAMAVALTPGLAMADSASYAPVAG